jgi:AAHS family 4-hydroxybenzoate transporter-like MFS transporter
VIAMVSEFAPRRSRATMVSVMYAAFPLGGVIGGPLSAHLLAKYGWEAVFVMGGIAPLLLLVVLAVALPESVRFLVARHAPADVIARSLRRLVPGLDFRDADRLVLLERVGGAGRPLGRIFSGELLRTSMLLGAASFATQLVIVYIITWMPTLLVASGVGLGAAILISATFSLGGIIGSLLLARIIDRVQSWWPLTAAFVLAGFAVAAVGLAPSHRVMLFAAVAQAGGLIVGAQVNLSAYCASVYPTDIRSTGLGWIIGLGRAGAICGALMGTAFVAAGLTLPSQYGVSGIATVVIALLLHATRNLSGTLTVTAAAPTKSWAE